MAGQLSQGRAHPEGSDTSRSCWCACKGGCLGFLPEFKAWATCTDTAAVGGAHASTPSAWCSLPPWWLTGHMLHTYDRYSACQQSCNVAPTDVLPSGQASVRHYCLGPLAGAGAVGGVPSDPGPPGLPLQRQLVEEVPPAADQHQPRRTLVGWPTAGAAVCRDRCECIGLLPLLLQQQYLPCWSE